MAQSIGSRGANSQTPFRINRLARRDDQQHPI